MILWVSKVLSLYDWIAETEDYILESGRCLSSEHWFHDWICEPVLTFSRLIAIIISSNTHSLSLDGAREIKNHLKKINDIEVMGPVDSPLLKIKKKFRSRLLIRYKGKNLIQKKISNLLNTLKISNKIKLIVDVDPVNFG